MDELRLEGMHDDGGRLVLADAAGTRYLLPVDHRLRTAITQAARASNRRSRAQSSAFGPRDIQARFRAGATVEEIVDESG